MLCMYVFFGGWSFRSLKLLDDGSKPLEKTAHLTSWCSFFSSTLLCLSCWGESSAMDSLVPLRRCDYRRSLKHPCSWSWWWLGHWECAPHDSGLFGCSSYNMLMSSNSRCIGLRNLFKREVRSLMYLSHECQTYSMWILKALFLWRWRPWSSTSTHFPILVAMWVTTRHKVVVLAFFESKTTRSKKKIESSMHALMFLRLAFTLQWASTSRRSRQWI